MTTLLLVGLALVVGAVVSYLFFRANPNKKSVVDKFTDKQSDKIRSLKDL